MPAAVPVYLGPTLGMGLVTPPAREDGSALAGAVSVEGEITGPDGWTAQLASEGIFHVIHNLGKTNFPVVCPATASAAMVVLSDVTPDRFTVKTFNGTPALSSTAFNFIVGA